MSWPSPWGCSRALCTAPGAQPKPPRPQPCTLCPPHQRALGPPGRRACLRAASASRLPPPPPRALRSPRCTCPQEPATCSAREVPFERQLLSPPWVVFWEHKRRKAVRLGEFSLLPCVPASTAGARQVRSGGGLGAERGVRHHPLSAPLSAHPPPAPRRPRLESSCKDPHFQGIVSVPRIFTVPLGQNRLPGFPLLSR